MITPIRNKVITTYTTMTQLTHTRTHTHTHKSTPHFDKKAVLTCNNKSLASSFFCFILCWHSINSSCIKESAKSLNFATKWNKKKHTWPKSTYKLHSGLPQASTCISDNCLLLTSIFWHSCDELVGSPIQVISFLSFLIMFIAIRTLRASYTLRLMFLWSTSYAVKLKSHSLCQASLTASLPLSSSPVSESSLTNSSATSLYVVHCFCRTFSHTFHEKCLSPLFWRWSPLPTEPSLLRLLCTNKNKFSIKRTFGSYSRVIWFTASSWPFSTQQFTLDRQTH